MRENSIEEVSVLVNSNGVRVVEFSLASGASGPMHSHSNVFEYCYCLEGLLSIDIEGEPSHVTLSLGEKIQIPVGKVHRVAGGGSSSSRFLVVQGIGDFDFVHV
jgi:quercetin dioxygenase-like cupin family protein